MKKIIFKMFVCICVLMGLMSIAAMAETETGTCGKNVNWSYDTESCVLTISGTGEMYNYDYQDKSQPWRFYQYDIKSVVVEDGVTNVGEAAFYSYSIESVVLAESVTHIGEMAFCSCDYLESVEMNGVTDIGIRAFKYCRGLETIEIPDSTINIGKEAFYVCSELKDVTIGANVEFIGDYGFATCSNIENVYIDNMDMWCEIDFADSYANPLNEADNLYVNSVLVTDIEIPYGVKEIKPYSFYGFEGVKSVKIPESVTKIGESAFECSVIPEIEIPGNVKEIGYSAFYLCMALEKVVIGDGVEQIAGNAFYDCDALESVIIPDSVTTIEDDSFASCTNLSEVYVGKGATSINRFAFSRNGNLKAINVSDDNAVYASVDGVVYTKDKKTLVICPGGITECFVYDGATTIGENAFCFCSKLKNVVLPDTITKIDNYSLNSCRSLESVTIPRSVKSIGINAFWGSESLSDVYYEGSKADWRNISINTGNELLENANIYYAGELIEAFVDNKNVTVTSKNVPEGGVVVITVICDGIVTAHLKEGNTTSEFAIEDNVDEVKVFVWDGLTTMEPLCEANVITFEN